MVGKNPVSRWFSALALLGLVELAVLAGTLVVSAPAQAQRFNEPRRQGGGGGFFDQLFGGFGGGLQGQPRYDVERPQPQADYSRAPAPHKPETPPTTSIVVMGDSMADWLAYGLEDAFTDTPEIGVVRKHRTFSGLIRYEARSDADWSRIAREILSQEKADYVVMMLGLNDRTAIREAQPPRNAQKGKEPPKDQKQQEAAKEANKEPAPDNADKPQQQADDPEQSSIVTPETTTQRAPGGSAEFRSDRWVELYTKRIDETIAALKSKGVPVFWVGLPAVRGTRSTTDVVFLNDLYRARAEKAGITYVDVWDGFVDEGGRYSQQGPDVDGQTRRLRAGDGVHFTKFGARKLAHYVEREIRRLLQNRVTPVALPGPGTAPGQPAPEAKIGPAARPLAGPVVPLNVVPAGSEELAGGPRPANADPNASRVLIKGEAITAAPGRADDFAWPRGSARVIVEPTSAATSASASVEPAAAQPAPVPTSLMTEPGRTEAPQQPTNTGLKGQGTAGTQQHIRPTTATGRPIVQQQGVRNAPPQQQQRPVARSFDPFGWFR